jgi:predicted HAD superfamily Cof-like phosphohydrolase
MQLIHNIFNWFQKAVPEPKSKNINTQLGVHIEEVAEMLDEMYSRDHVTYDLIKEACTVMEQLAERLKITEIEDLILLPNREKFLDSLCDQIVTATGVGHMMGMNLPDALDEVNKSNYSKFVNGEPIFNENLKIIKGPDYFIANVKPFI